MCITMSLLILCTIQFCWDDSFGIQAIFNGHFKQGCIRLPMAMHISLEAQAQSQPTFESLDIMGRGTCPLSWGIDRGNDAACWNCTRSTAVNVYHAAVCKMALDNYEVDATELLETYGSSVFVLLLPTLMDEMSDFLMKYIIIGWFGSLTI